MKTLCLLRHAKSNRDDPTLHDRDRPLEARGEHDAEKMGKRWSQRLAAPDLILSSPALRALSTARIVAEGLGCKLKQIVVNESLYDATPAALLAVIEGLDDEVKRVMLVAHNPGLADLARRFDTAIDQMPTCALAEFTFDTRTWSGLGRLKPERSAFDSPKQAAA
jgi:phosphohistidine phosphatase